MKRTLLAALSFVAAAASAQNLPLWWNGTTATNSSSDQTIATAFDASNNLFVLYEVGGGTAGRLTKYDNKGLVIWSATIHPATTDVVTALALDASGNAVVTGTTATGATPNLLLAKVDGATGNTTIFSKNNPITSGQSYKGYGVTVAGDGTIYVAGNLRQTGQDRPYVVKYSADGTTELFRQGLTTRSGYFSEVNVASSGKVLLAGNLTSASSVVVGYTTTAGAAIVSQLPTSASSTFEKLTGALFIGDRIVWNGYSATDNAGTTGLRRHYGQYDFTDGSNGGSEFTGSTATGIVGNGLAYDSTTGTLALQFTDPSVTGSIVQLATIDTSNDTFVLGSSYTHTGSGVGITAVTDGNFASYSQSGGVQTGFLVVPGDGVVSSTSAGAGSVSLSAGSYLNNPHSPVSVRDRATAVGGSAGTGATVHSLSYIAGPADDSRRMKEDTTYAFNVLLNDPGLGAKTVGANTPASHGMVTIAGDGSLSYTPTADFYGVDSFTYDEYVNGFFFATRTVTMTVLNVNDGPTAVNDDLGEISNSGLITITLPVLSNDLNPDGIAHPIRFLSVTQPGNGTVYLTDSKTQLKIKAAPGAAGQAFSFTYTIQNGTGMTSTATVTGTFAP